MLGIILLNRIPNERIRQITKIGTVVHIIIKIKWAWPGHIARMSRDRWTKRIMEYRLWANTHGRGHPPLVWVDELNFLRVANGCMQAQKRHKWRNMEKAYIRRCMEQRLLDDDNIYKFYLIAVSNRATKEL